MLIFGWLVDNERPEITAPKESFITTQNRFTNLHTTNHKRRQYDREKSQKTRSQEGQALEKSRRQFPIPRHIL